MNTPGIGATQRLDERILCQQLATDGWTEEGLTPGANAIIGVRYDATEFQRV